MPANLNRKQQREIKAVVERAKKDNGIPQTAQQSIPFQRMFPDGICRVTDSYSHVKKAADRADKAVDRAEKAADKLASKKAKPKLKLETDAAGSRKAKLRFEKAEFTEIERPSVAKHMASRGAAVTLTSKAHRAVSEYEDDNIGVQAVQETTKAVESTVYTVDHYRCNQKRKLLLYHH